jgi:hypothetical protein
MKRMLLYDPRSTGFLNLGKITDEMDHIRVLALYGATG